MAKVYERQTKGAIIERAEGGKAGLISGIVGSGGEASDGHRINVAGVQITDNTPMLFEHWRTLGIWNEFTKHNEDNPAEATIRGVGEIKIGGEGSEKEWRNDVDYMVGEKVIGGLSMRWEAIDRPQLRTTLSQDHWAFVDGEEATGAQEWGLYFHTAEMTEDSVVTFGADKAALIERMDASQGGLRSFWGQVLARETGVHDIPELLQVLEEISKINKRLDDYDGANQDFLRRMFAKDATLLDGLEEFLSSDTDDPPPAQATEQGLAAQPDDEEADQQPPKTVTSETLQAALLKRQRGPAEVKRLFKEELDKAQGRVT